MRRPSKKAAALADGLAVSPDHLQFSEEAKGRKTGKRQPQKRKRGSDLDNKATGSLLSPLAASADPASYHGKCIRIFGRVQDKRKSDVCCRLRLIITEI